MKPWPAVRAMPDFRFLPRGELARRRQQRRQLLISLAVAVLAFGGSLVAVCLAGLVLAGGDPLGKLLAGTVYILAVLAVPASGVAVLAVLVRLVSYCRGFGREDRRLAEEGLRDLFD